MSTKKGNKTSKHGRYLMTPKQMSEARHIEAVMYSRMKRGEITGFNLFQCGCGCGCWAGSK